MRKKTEQDYHDLIQTRGIEWVGEFPKNTSAKTEWQCTKGHIWSAAYHKINQGYGCPYCFGNARKTEQDYHNVAKTRGFKWVDKALPKDVCTKTMWYCQESHEWHASFSAIQRGRGCPHCAGQARKTEQDYHNLAAQMSIEWIDEILPKNTKTKTAWKCSKGQHIWRATYNNIRKGSGCPYCAGRARKTEKDYHDLATIKDFEWIGDILPEYVFDKTLWRCGCGHNWTGSYNKIHSGNGCPYCAGQARKTKQDYYSLAQKRNFRWIGVFPKNIKEKTLWRCPNGHEWLARYNDIQQGVGCPHCQNRINGFLVSSQQIVIAEMVNGEINYPFGRKRIDIALPDQMIAIEYDSWYWHGNQQKEDRQRAQELIDAGWKILSIKSNNDIPTKQSIFSCLAQLECENEIELILKDWGDGDRFNK